jgi:DAK2 domain fusion protein YloV
MASGTACLFAHKTEVDALNVFPVPDGDTGTNMYLTFQSALREANQNSSNNLNDILESAAYGALMGARGNSGVIISQFFRGFVKALPNELEHISKLEIEKGLNGASVLCFQAVRQPVEGTVLTVIKEIAKYASENLTQKATLESYIKNIYNHANLVLAQTPEMLPVLKKAGVVDAGAQGLVYYLKGIVQHLNGEEFENISSESVYPVKVMSVGQFPDNELLVDEEINFQYCTEFILKGKQLDLEYIKNSLSPHGDCLLVVGDENNTKIHLHTNNPGIILDFAVRLGDLSEIQINNMVEQNQKRLAQRNMDNSSNRQIGIVAVTAGDGLERIFRSLGVQCIVNGGQTMNPSIEDLTKAVSALSSSKVIILPNNSNIIMTASHVQELTTKEVKVIPTQSIPEGLAAIMNFSDERPLEENAERMAEKSSTIITGEVTYAVRGFQFNDQQIKQGDNIGLVNGEIVACSATPEQVVENVLKSIPAANSGLISIYYGQETTAITAQDLLNKLEKNFPGAEIELYYGGQPLYYYLLSIE